jgi:OOP family OmpA-OmpF porin
MRIRPLLAAGVLWFAPAVVRAQDVPAAVPAREPSAPVATRRQGSVELSLGGGFSLVDRALNSYLSLNTTRIANPNPGRVMMGGQVRATINVSRHLGLGAGAAMTNGNGALLIAPFGALTYTLDLNRGFSPFIDLGAGVTRIAAYTGGLLGDATYHETSSYSAFGGLGFRAMLGGALTLRVEGRMSYDQFAGFGKAAFNSAGFVGLSLFVGGGRQGDSDGDGDGVPDRRDGCPETPPGATVDANGCQVDSDNDGVADGLDRCPDTPAGASVDAHGCPVDSDGDGVPDYLDRCADTPGDARPVYPAGHARAGCPVDSDGDGVADYVDRCPNTARGTQVDASGCPVRRDSDGDGVSDARDRCPNTPPGTRVDANGCPLAAEPAAPAAFVLRAVTFRPNTAVLVPSSGAELDNVAASLRSMPDARWRIAGYTDSRGIPARNVRLSRQRAEAVMRYLVAQGVPSTSLTAVGYGAQNPAASNATVAGRARNRRVEITQLP